MRTGQASIKRRVQAVILLASVIVLLVTAAAFVAYEAIEFRSALVRKLSTLAAVIADNSAAPLAFNNKTVAEEILAALRAEPYVEAAVLFDDEGEIFATFPKELPPGVLPAFTAGKRYEIRDGALVFYEPVLQEGKPIGNLYLRNSFRGLYEQLWRYALIVAGVLLGALGTALLLSNLLQKRISEPILALTEVARRISEQRDYSVRAPKTTQDEIGLLTDAFNRMLSETQANQDRLTEQTRLLDLSTDAIIVRDLEGRILFWNRGAEDLYGWNRSQAIGKKKQDLLQTEFSEPPEQIYSSLQHRGRWSGELSQTRSDGTRVHVSTRWVLDPQTPTAPARILITDNDITERKQIEEALRQNEERLNGIIASAMDGVISINSEQRIVLFNRAAEKMFGVSETEILGKSIDQLIPAQFRGNHPAYVREFGRTGVSNRQMGALGTIRGLRATGEEFPIEASISQVQIGREKLYTVVLRDITERNRAEELMRSEAKRLDALVQQRTASLQETIGELEAFSYSVSHDMRAPLRAMQGYAQALLADYKNRLDSEAQQYLDRIFRSANRLDLLVQDVLAYSRVTKGEVELRTIDVERLLDDIIAATPEFQEPRARIKITRPLHRVIGHEAYLTQCITNLLGNAVKFVSREMVPNIVVRSEVRDRKVRMWFEDNGIGIDPAHHERIFNMFGQVHPQKKYGGTGIGLAIVRKAAQRMNGEVGVDSALDKGSRFWLLLNGVNHDDNESRHIVG